MPPRHRVTALVSHLPCPLPPSQSVICLAPCHQTSQSFALPPTTTSLCHCTTTSPRPPCHRITALVSHFALPPATKPVSHLPCPLPPNQSAICLAPYHRVTALVSHLPCPLPPSQSVICLAPCHQTSLPFALPPTTVSPHHCATASPHHCISQSFALPPATKPVSHLPCPLPPNQSVICLAPLPPCPPHHCATASPHHCISQSFALPPATKPVSHLPCPLPPNQSVICLAPYHRVTASLH